MKFVVVLGDGMADWPIEQLGNKTPLEIAKKPHIDSLAKISEVGLVKTVPDGLKPGSDVANLSVLGYDPKVYYSGRSPLEAASIGIDLKETDITARANLVTLSDEEVFEDKTMIDYSAGEISTEEAKELITYLASKLNTDELKLYSGVSYRHCLVIDNGKIAGDLTPPHDITGKPIKEHLPTSTVGALYLELMKKSVELLKDHPINKARIKLGKRPATSLWFWGEGTKPKLDLFYEKFGVKGAMISAVDLLKGIAKLTDMKNIEVDGATGNWDTNFLGKAKACVNALKDGADLVYIHMEAPDECGHQGNLEKKIYSIEQISEVVVKYLLEELPKLNDDFSILILPDHPTPIKVKTHVSDAVPYLIYRSNFKQNGASAYTEIAALNSKITVPVGHDLMKKFINNY